MKIPTHPIKINKRSNSCDDVFQHAGGITGITENHLFRWIVEQTNLQNRYHYEYLQGSRKIFNPRSFVFHNVLHLHQKSSKEYLGFPRDPPLQLSLPLYV